MKIEQTSAKGSPVVKQTSPAGKANPSAASAPETAAADSVELSPQAKKLAKAQQNAPVQTQADTQLTTLLASAKNLVASNPAKALSQLQLIIAQDSDSPEAQKAQELLARLPKSGK